MSGVSHFRGHLFADLRGSTAYTQRAGNAAGAELVQRFRQMVRDEVATHDGAEVKTEGDAVYVVFPSASTAVMCGLALVESAQRASAEDPATPIHMGVGIHAGEAVEVPEGGYIGTAVNLAARVCAVAGAGEVLVSGTVREIVQGSIPVTFASRGKRRLKGIGEPVDLWRAIPAGMALPEERRVDRRLLVGGAAVLGLAAVSALAFMLLPGGSPSATPSATPQPTSQRLAIGRLDIGEYVSTAFDPAFTLAVTDPGWTLTGERAASAELLREEQPRGTLTMARLTGIHTDPCNPDGGYPAPAGETPEELVEALRLIYFLEVGEPTPILIDRRPGLELDFMITDSAFAACDQASEVALFPLGDRSFAASPGDRVRIQAVDVGGRTISFLMVSSDDTSVPITEIEAFFALAENLVDSMRFGV